jgi:hypothetical protein
MNILITGVTETHINHPDRASSTKFVSIPEMMASAYRDLGYNVAHRAVTVGEDLSVFDAVFVYVYPLDSNVIDYAGAVYALEQKPNAYICLDDWSFQEIMPTWEKVIDLQKLQSHVWLAPLFPWGDVDKMDLQVDRIIAWDPSPLYEPPAVHQLSWGQRKKEWYNASLSTGAHLWANAQHLKWPIYAIGGKKLGQPRKLESNIVWEYGFYKGILCPTYEHAGCGWWRVRYLHAKLAGCVLGGDRMELGAIGPAYSFTLHEIEDMDDYTLQKLVAGQRKELLTASRFTTINALKNLI